MDRRGGGNGRGTGGGTALYDAVFLSADEITAKQKGRRAVILLTDGVDRGSKKTLAASIDPRSARTRFCMPSTSRVSSIATEASGSQAVVGVTAVDIRVASLEEAVAAVVSVVVEG